MKIYFDTLSTEVSNLKHLAKNGDNEVWIVSNGTNIKRKFSQMGLKYDLLSDLDSPGLYIIDVNGDPKWWNGVLTTDLNAPKTT